MYWNTWKNSFKIRFQKKKYFLGLAEARTHKSITLVEGKNSRCMSRIMNITCVSKKPGQIIVLYHYILWFVQVFFETDVTLTFPIWIVNASPKMSKLWFIKIRVPILNFFTPFFHKNGVGQGPLSSQDFEKFDTSNWLAQWLSIAFTQSI